MTREKLLGQARADLVALPDLDEERQRLEAGERHHDVSNYRSKVIGSPSPADIPNVHLSDTRHKPGWWGEDPRMNRSHDRYGIAPTLETWVRVLWEELPEIPDLTEIATVRSECATLLEHWEFITSQSWSIELAEDVSRIATTVRAQLGIRPEYRPRCRWCPTDPVTKQRPLVHPVEANTQALTTWEACAYGLCSRCGRTYPKGPALDALAKVQEPMPIKDIAGITGISVPTLHRWHDDGLITPTNGERRPRKYDLATVQEAAAKMRRTA